MTLQDGAAQTPLLDLLRDIPLDARMTYEHSPTEHSMIPVGRLAKQAADALDRLERENEALRADAERFRKALTGYERGCVIGNDQEGAGYLSVFLEAIKERDTAIDAAKEQKP